MCVFFCLDGIALQDTAAQSRMSFVATPLLSDYMLRVAIVIRTHDGPKNPYILLFLLTILGPDYCVPLQ